MPPPQLTLACWRTSPFAVTSFGIASSRTSDVVRVTRRVVLFEQYEFGAAEARRNAYESVRHGDSGVKRTRRATVTSGVAHTPPWLATARKHHKRYLRDGVVLLVLVNAPCDLAVPRSDVLYEDALCCLDDLDVAWHVRDLATSRRVARMTSEFQLQHADDTHEPYSVTPDDGGDVRSYRTLDSWRFKTLVVGQIDSVSSTAELAPCTREWLVATYPDMRVFEWEDDDDDDDDDTFASDVDTVASDVTLPIVATAAAAALPRASSPPRRVIDAFALRVSPRPSPKRLKRSSEMIPVSSVVAFGGDDDDDDDDTAAAAAATTTTTTTVHLPTSICLQPPPTFQAPPVPLLPILLRPPPSLLTPAVATPAVATPAVATPAVATPTTSRVTPFDHFTAHRCTDTSAWLDYFLLLADVWEKRLVGVTFVERDVVLRSFCYPSLEQINCMLERDVAHVCSRAPGYERVRALCPRVPCSTTNVSHFGRLGAFQCARTLHCFYCGTMRLTHSFLEAFDAEALRLAGVSNAIGDDCIGRFTTQLALMDFQGAFEAARDDVQRFVLASHGSAARQVSMVAFKQRAFDLARRARLLSEAVARTRYA